MALRVDACLAGKVYSGLFRIIICNLALILQASPVKRSS